MIPFACKLDDALASQPAIPSTCGCVICTQYSTNIDTITRCWSVFHQEDINPEGDVQANTESPRTVEFPTVLKRPLADTSLVRLTAQQVPLRDPSVPSGRLRAADGAYQERLMKNLKELQQLTSLAPRCRGLSGSSIF